MTRFAYSRSADSRFVPQIGKVFTEPHREAFARRGFVWDEERPDVLFCVPPTTPMLDGSTPFIVCAREPSCDFTNSLLSNGSFWDDDPRRLIDSPTFLGIFKERRFRDVSLLDQPRLGGRWLNNVLLEAYQSQRVRDRAVEGFLQRAPSRQYTPDQRRLYCQSTHVLWDFHFSPMSHSVDLLCRSAWRALASCRRTRVLDVFCSIAVHKNVPDFALVSWHREQCLRQLERLPHRRKSGVRIAHARRYLLHLLTAKISISPWGGGAWCIRDVESILAGCVTIKPPCPWVAMAGFDDLYQPDAGYFVPCRPDFCDLPDVIERILSDYPTHFQRTQDARRRLLRERSVGRVIDRITSETRQLLETR